MSGNVAAALRSRANQKLLVVLLVTNLLKLLDMLGQCNIKRLVAPGDIQKLVAEDIERNEDALMVVVGQTRRKRAGLRADNLIRRDGGVFLLPFLLRKSNRIMVLICLLLVFFRLDFRKRNIVRKAILLVHAGIDG